MKKQLLYVFMAVCLFAIFESSGQPFQPGFANNITISNGYLEMVPMFLNHYASIIWLIMIILLTALNITLHHISVTAISIETTIGRK